VAGLLLKNSLKERYGPPKDDAEAIMLSYLKSTVLVGLQDKDHMIRQTVAAVITSLISNEDPGAWPEALNTLTAGMSSADFNVVEVSDIRD
jgi:transportin-1